jgi:hypothetical protein
MNGKQTANVVTRLMLFLFAMNALCRSNARGVSRLSKTVMSKLDFHQEFVTRTGQTITSIPF